MIAVGMVTKRRESTGVWFYLRLAARAVCSVPELFPAFCVLKNEYTVKIRQGVGGDIWYPREFADYQKNRRGQWEHQTLIFACARQNPRHYRAARL